MASQRRIHNFAQQHRLPSIEVYSSSPHDFEPDEFISSGTSNGVVASNGGRPIRLTKQNLLADPRDFRILSSSLAPLTRRISNSRSTGNLTRQEESLDHSQNGVRMTLQPVHHAASHGRLSAGTRQNSSASPSPTLNRRRQRGELVGMQRFTSFDDAGQHSEQEYPEEYPERISPRQSMMTFSGSSEPVTVLGNIIRPGTHETTARRMEIRYSARNDKYKRPTNPIRTKANGWNTLVYAERNMEWVTEHCHIGDDEEVMTYLSRKPGTSSAYVEWRFDFAEAGLRVKRCSLKFPFETFEDGLVRVCLKPNSDDPPIPVYSSLLAVNMPQIRGWDRFSLIAELSCSQREVCAFQHAQLFRQQLKSGFFDKQEEKYQFKIELELYSMY